jgi:hypothetical protein
MRRNWPSIQLILKGRIFANTQLKRRKPRCGNITASSYQNTRLASIWTSPERRRLSVYVVAGYIALATIPELMELIQSLSKKGGTATEGGYAHQSDRDLAACRRHHRRSAETRTLSRILQKYHTRFKRLFTSLPPISNRGECPAGVAAACAT